MKNHLKRYRIDLTTLGPVFIGSGQEIMKSEWIRIHNEILIMDPRKLMKELQKMGVLDQYINSMLHSRLPLWKWAKDNQISDSLFRKASSYSLNVDDMDNRELNTRNIMGFIKDPYQNPYVPGSSLKGTVRNILLASKIRKNGYDTRTVKEEIDTFQGNRRYFLSGESKKLEIEMFHTAIHEGSKKQDAVNDEMRGIRFSDSEPLSLSDLMLCLKVDMHKDGDDRDIPLLRESLRPGTEITFTMTIDQTETDITAEEILEAVDAFYADYQKMFLQHFMNYKEAENEMTLRGEHILYLGGGVGYSSKTVINQLFRDEPRSVQYISGAIQTSLTGGKTPKEKSKDHHLDVTEGVSPRVVKMTEVNGRLVQMGPCDIRISAI